ncbi:MAG: hypothetical protein Q8O67_07260 [Deltaproteobacteria bacterium]|nr:hypothetical protein [Deltaproteobacteria bacterium]
MIANPRIRVVVGAVVDAAVALSIPVPLERFHERGHTARMVRLLGDKLALACTRDPIVSLLDELSAEIGAAAFGDVELVRQLEPCVRVNPPRCPALAVPFHTDAWAGNPRQQRAIWIPLVDIQADEGLWIADDDAGRCFASGVDGQTARLHAVHDQVRAASQPVRMSVGEAIVFDADVAHGSVPHEVDRTRWSVDVRVAPASAVRLTGWRARALSPMAT